MDTRDKIVSPESIVATGRVALLIGYFDPMIGEDAARVRDLRSETTIVAIDEVADAFLPVRARAELVASLSAVDYVTADVGGVKARFPDAVVHDLRDDHLQSRRDLVAHVLRRQRGE